MMKDMKQYGLTDRILALASMYPELTVGRIVSQEKGLYRIVTSKGEKLSSQCRFKDCSHHNEPGCAVQRALQDGTLLEERWLSYQKLKTENEYAMDSQSYLTGKEKKFKAIAKINKSNRKR